MNCNLDLIISSIVLNYLNKIDKNIGNLFQKKTNALTLAKGSPIINDIFNHFIQTNSKSKKIRFNAIEDAEQTSEDEDIPQSNPTNSNSLNPIKIETKISGGSVCELDDKSSRKSDIDNFLTEKPGSSKEPTVTEKEQQNQDNTAASGFMIDRMPDTSDHILQNYSNAPINFNDSNNSNSFDNYFDSMQQQQDYINENHDNKRRYRRWNNYGNKKSYFKKLNKMKHSQKLTKQ